MTTPVTTVDLTSAAAPASAAGSLEDLPRRVALTLAELRHLADLAGGAPLPFDTATDAPHSTDGTASPAAAAPAADDLEARLGAQPADPGRSAYDEVVAGLHEPADSLERRGLLVDGVADAGVIGALGLLATPVLAVDLEVRVGTERARAWHRQSTDAVATLATTDGIVFELAWFEPRHWAAELAQVATPPEDVGAGTTDLPEVLDLPFELVDGVGEALASGRPDLVHVIVAAHAGEVRADATTVPDAAVAGLLTAMLTDATGRLRGMAADVATEGAPVIGVVSWLLLPDGWRSLRSYDAGGRQRLELRRVAPGALASLLAPVLAEVIR